jgi:serine/threonine protein kinase
MPIGLSLNISSNNNNNSPPKFAVVPDKTYWNYNPTAMADSLIREIYSNIVETIHDNGYSTVNKCRDSTGRLYIVKINPSKPDERFIFKKNYEKYIHLVDAKFSFIMPLLYAEIFNKNSVRQGKLGSNFSITPYVEGKSLDKFEGNSLDSEIVFSIMQQLKSALEQLSSKNFIHRDIKPENIFIGKDYKVYLLDFDELCNTVWGQREKMGCVLLGLQNNIRGTRKYARPNSIRTRPYKYTFKNDLYSLGLVIKELSRISKSKKEAIELQGITMSILNKTGGRKRTNRKKRV